MFSSFLAAVSWAGGKELLPMLPENPGAAAGISAASRRWSLIACAAAALLAGLVYLNALRNPFVFDDYRTILDNGSIVNLRDLRTIVLHDATRPVVNLSYAIDRAMWG